MLTLYIYIAPIIVSLLGGLAIYMTVKNTDRATNTFIFIYDVVNIISLFYISLVSHNSLPIYVNKFIRVTWVFSVMGGIVYLVSLVMCLLKNKKLREDSNTKVKIVFLLILMVAPMLLFGGFCLYEQAVIDSAEILIKGKTGDGYTSKEFTIAVTEFSIIESSIDVDDSYFYHKSFLLPSHTRQITHEELQDMGRDVFMDGHYFRYFKDGEEIKRVKIKYDEYDSLDSFYFIR